MKLRSISRCIAFVAVIALLGAVFIFANRVLPDMNNSPTGAKMVSAPQLAALVQRAQVPLYVEVCSTGTDYGSCSSQAAAVTDAARHFRGEIAFVTIDASVADNAPLLQQLGLQRDLPAHILIKDGAPYWKHEGVMTATDLKAGLGQSMLAFDVDGSKLVQNVDVKTLAGLVTDRSKPTVIVFCSDSDGSCKAEQAAVNYSAAFYAGQVRYAFFNIDTATTEQDQQMVLAVAQALGVKALPTVVYLDAKYNNVSDAATPADLNVFVSDCLSKSAAMH